MRLHRAWTLVENLVVVAILVVLGALVYAAMGPARESGRRAQCVSNLRQIGQAIRLYSDEYSGVDPEVGVRATAARLGVPIAEALPRFKEFYFKHAAVWYCPSYHGPLRREQLTTTYTWYPDNGEGPQPEPSRYPSLVERRGPDTPIAVCESHNATWDLRNEPRWTLKRIVVLRLDGSVRERMVSLREPSQNW